MKLFAHFSLYRLASVSTLIGAAFFWSAASVCGETWSRTVLGQSGLQFDEVTGLPVLDIYGYQAPRFPKHYQPSAIESASGINVLRFSYSYTPIPLQFDPNGFQIFGDYFRFDSLLYNGNTWVEGEPFTDWMEGVFSPSYVSCMDGALKVSYWKEHLLCIDTLEGPSSTRLTLPIPAMKGTVAVDANGGVHVISIDADYELWHRYYSDGALSSVKLSDGPVCDVVAVAGEGDTCHVVYTTFSEDLNSNEIFDDGEDVNENGQLDVVPNGLAYQLIDVNVPDPVEILVVDTLIRVCYLDLLFSTTYGLKLVYADPVTNSIRLFERGLSTWSAGQISSSVGSYGPVALDIQADGDAVVSFATQNGLKLSITEEDSGVWTETLIRETSVSAYFTGTDVVVRANGDVVVLTSQRNDAGSSLAAYTISVLPSFLVTQVQPVSIRGAFIVTWPTPGQDVTQQILQSTGDLSDPNSWEDLEQKDWNQWDDRVALETVVEREVQKFYRVLETSD